MVTLAQRTDCASRPCVVQSPYTRVNIILTSDDVTGVTSPLQNAHYHISCALTLAQQSCCASCCPMRDRMPISITFWHCNLLVPPAPLVLRLRFNHFATASLFLSPTATNNNVIPTTLLPHNSKDPLPLNSPNPRNNQLQIQHITRRDTSFPTHWHVQTHTARSSTCRTST